MPSSSTPSSNTQNSNLELSFPGQTLDELLAVSADDITTIVDKGVEFHGELKITNGKTILISGTVVGKITSNGTVVINQDAEVRGSIQAKALQVGGRVVRDKEGDCLDIEEAIVVAKTATLDCDTTAKGIKTEFGADISGRFQPRAKSAAPAQRPQRAEASGTPGAGDTVVREFPAHAAGR